jgi:RHS repeat-associated protein
MAKANPFRFSTKYQDDETDLLYYGYRYYNASTGRWNSRDPIMERGSKNLYALCHNESVSFYDVLGYEEHSTITRNIEEEMRNSANGCVEMTLAEFLSLLKSRGLEVNFDQRKQFYRGCIGLCALAQASYPTFGPYQNHPEDTPNTKCFLKPEEAKARKCKEGETSFVFSKQGHWVNKSKPDPREDGSVPNDSVVPDSTGHFNYVTCNGGYYIWMDHYRETLSGGMDRTGTLGENPNKPQHVKMCLQPCDDPAYPDKIWCSTCRKCNQSYPIIHHP